MTDTQNSKSFVSGSLEKMKDVDAYQTR